MGFIDNPQRINVALTRARKNLFILGDIDELERNSLWKRILDYCAKLSKDIASEAFGGIYQQDEFEAIFNQAD